jgi:hypothetical protein
MNFITKNFQENKNKPNFVEQIRTFFASLRQNHLGANNFKEEKEEIKNYQEIIEKERSKRKNNDPLDMEIEKVEGKGDGELRPEKTDFGKVSETFEISDKIISESRDKKPDNIENIKKKFAQSWEAPKILKTNLVKGENTTFIDWHHNFNLLVWACLSAFFLLVVIYGGLIYWETTAQKQKIKLDSEIETIKKQIIAESGKVEQIDIFQEKLKYAAWLMEKHIYFSRFFKFLENSLLPDVYLTDGFSGKPDGNYSLQAETDNFKTLSNQLLFLKNRKEVISAVADGGTISANKGKQVGKESLKFNLNLKLVPEVFLIGSSTESIE